jgi:hypothetical protein
MQHQTKDNEFKKAPDSNKNIPESEFTRDTITRLGNKVRLTDSCDGLELFCYQSCTEEDDVSLQSCRGVIFNDNDIVMKAFPYTVEYIHTNKKNIEESINQIFKDCSFYDAHEGALIRMFYFNNKWYISTHRKLDAFRSKWASKESFGTSFKLALEAYANYDQTFKNNLPTKSSNIIENFQETLDKNKQYMFLISHNAENRIVCITPQYPIIYHVGTFVNGELNMTENCGIPYPRKYDFNDMDSLLEYVNNIDYRYLQGIICFAPNNKQYKIIHKEYDQFFKVRGNEPSIKFRYLEIRMNRKLTEMLFFLYPHMNFVFDEIENTIYAICKNIYNAYVQRFIKKRFVTVPTEEFSVIRECHSWHEEDRGKNKINLEKIITVFNKQNPSSINRMIRRFKLEKEQKKLEKQQMYDNKKENTISTTTTPDIKGVCSTTPSPLLLPTLNIEKEVETIDLN